MSFSRSFTFYVSGSVSYPPSKNGGSASYHDSVDVTVDIDTSAFDDSVRRCDHQVCRLRNSVVESARQIVAEKSRSAKKIASTIVGGFFKYVRYEIGEKMMRLKTRVPMLLQALKGLAGHCSATRSQLEKDYQHITSRYTKIFDDLQAALYSALVGLDGPIYQLSKMVDGIVLNSTLNIITTETILTGLEQASAVNGLEIMQVKNAARKVVSECARNIMYNIRLEQQIEHMLRRNAIVYEHHVYMPIVQIESDSLENNSEAHEYVFSGAFPSSKAIDLYDKVAGKAKDGFKFANMLDSSRAMLSVDRFFRTRLSEDVSRLTDPIFAKRFCSEVARMWKDCMPAVTPSSDNGNLLPEKED